jgi:hypothetical protein
MMKNKKVSGIILFFCLIILISPIFSSAQTTRSSLTEIHNVEILDAYYIEDDIYTKISILVQTQSVTENYYLKICLINPIDDEINFIFHIIASLEQVFLEIVFYNYATIGGDYTIIASIVSNSGWFGSTDMIIFDPPSGGSEGDPYIGITFY